MTSLLKISEEIISILGKGTVQEISEAVKSSYAYLAKKQWWENYKEGYNEVDPSGLYVFNELTIKQDTTQNRYYVDLPSRYLMLSHEMGINFVGFTKAQDQGFIRLPAATLGLFSNLKSFHLGGRGSYTIEGTRVYFDKMNAQDAKGNITLKLSIALDTIEVDEPINAPPNMIMEIIQLVVAQYQPKKDLQPDNLV